GFGLTQLQLLGRHLCGRLRLQIGAQQGGAFARLAPTLAVFFHLPGQTDALGCVAQRDLIEVVDGPMAGLNLSQPPLHLMAIFQPAQREGLLQAVQSFFHAAGKTISDSLLFFFAARRATQNVILRALPYLRSTMRSMVSMVETSARLPSNVS